MRDGTATITVERGEIDLTVMLAKTFDLDRSYNQWIVLIALDEAGEPIELTPEEALQARCAAAYGLDEAGQ